jgi:DNA-binding transcriptional regulator LsrR (DeoR family)
MARIDELRLITKVARLYHEQGLRQDDIVEKVGLSQSTVSRLLKRAQTERIVRISVTVPSGVHTELEEKLQTSYGLKEAVVVDSDDGESSDARVLRDIGAAAAFHVEAILKRGEVVGISSWSRALLAMMDTMPRMLHATNAQVVQILGGIGDPVKDAHASALTRQFADLVRGQPRFLPAPGVVRSVANRRFFLRDKFVRETMDLFPCVTLALVGIGAVGRSKELSSSGVVVSDPELSNARERGAVGDLCLRFFDRNGRPVLTALDKCVIGMQLEQLRKVNRCIGVAGGRGKVEAIRGAIKGGWVNGLITDRATAERLLGEQPA